MSHYQTDNPTGGCQAMFIGTLIGGVILAAIVVLSFMIARVLA